MTVTDAPERTWYKDAVIYEVHVRAFADSDGDGIGDFRGLTTKLDYLQDLGVTALWLLPFYPSPLRDDGYDIADYRAIHPSYGTLDDFAAFLAEAHRRGLRVITELVLNHTSDQHPWFRAARAARPGSPERAFYVWSDTPQPLSDARIIFKDFEASNWTWDPVAGAFYWHRFYAHQPDLNFDNPAVEAAMLEVVDFWLGLGVDGLRLDAVPYLYEREGTNCENLPETHAFLRRLRRHVDERFPGRMLLAEANQWPEDATAYFGAGDECHMAFHFPVMPRLFMAIHMEDRHPLVEILRQTPAIPEECQWVVFLRNHDELTLEMVTDEDRDYMYRVYARDQRARINLGIRRRLAPLLGNNRRRIELMNALLFSLPGTPIIYYGDEIGMGDNLYLGDRNGVRTPMQWTAGENAGFSRASSQRLYLPLVEEPEYRHETVNVEAQLQNRHSLLWWTKRLIVTLRRELPALARGSIEVLSPENRQVLAFLRRYGAQTILIVANLSRFAQWAALDLGEFRGAVPRELFSHVRFPPIRGEPYVLTFAPHTFFWLALEPAGPRPADDLVHEVAGPTLEAAVARRSGIERAVPPYLGRAPWFRGGDRTVLRTEVVGSVPVPLPKGAARLLVLDARYVEGEPESYLLPVRLGPEGTPPAEVVARVRQGADPTGEPLLVDAAADRSLMSRLLQVVARQQTLKGDGADEVVGVAFPPLGESSDEALRTLEPAPLQVEQRNTSVAFGRTWVLKLYRRIEAGVSLDLELGRTLTERCGFRRTPRVAGALELRSGPGEPRTLAVLQEFVPHEGTAWRYARDAAVDLFEHVLARSAHASPPAGPLPDELARTLGELHRAYQRSVGLLGTRTAELHVALASLRDDPAFAPEPFTLLYQRSLQQALQSGASDALDRLRRRAADVPEEARELGRRLEQELDALRHRIGALLHRRVEAQRIRCHGDLHLGQLLHTGDDYVVTDFEGAPERPLSERRIKRCPLRDVASLLRSFEHAADATLREGRFKPEDVARLAPWARWWSATAGATFLGAYRAAVAPARLVPAGDQELAPLLEFFRLIDAVRDVHDCLRERPQAVTVPLRALVPEPARAPK